MSVASNGAPTVEDVAQAIGAEPAQLDEFVRHHPDPSAAHVLGAFNADPQHRQLVAEWLVAFQKRREKQREQRREREKTHIERLLWE